MRLVSIGVSLVSIGVSLVSIGELSSGSCSGSYLAHWCGTCGLRTRVDETSVCARMYAYVYVRTRDDVAKASEKGGWSCRESMELRVAGRDAGRALY